MKGFSRYRSLVWSIFLFLWDTMVLFFASIGRRVGKSESVAIIRLDAIGDFVVWIGCAEKIQRQYGSKKSVLIANSVWSEFARGMGIWSDVWSVDVSRIQRNIVYRAKALSFIRRYGFSVAVNPTHSRNFNCDDAVLRATNARQKIGSRGDNANTVPMLRKLADNFYTGLIDVPDDKSSEVSRNADFLRGNGIEVSALEITDLRRHSNEWRHRISLSEPYFVLVPGGSWIGKRWPLEKFSDIADYLTAAYGLKGVICGAENEVDLAEQISRRSKYLLVNAAGKTDLFELVGLIQYAHIVVTNDTSAVHIAASLGTPAVCVLGGGHFGRFAPYQREWRSPGVLPVSVYKKMSCFNCNWNCIYDTPCDRPVPCIDQIEVGDVARAIDSVLSRRSE